MRVLSMVNLKIIVVADNINFDLFALERYGLGGSESALLNLCFEFAKLGHEVIIYAGTEENKNFIKSHVHKNVAFHDIKLLKNKKILCDIFIGLRSCKIFLDYDLSYADFKVFWSQDTRYHASTEHLFNNTSNVLNKIDKIVVLSAYTYNQFKSENIEEINNKLVRIQNGYNHNFLVPHTNTNNNINFIYTSTPYRGLVYLVDMWPYISKKYNNIKLNIFTGMELYGEKNDSLNSYIYNRISRYKNINLHKPVSQKDLFKILSCMDVLLYPNEYPEAGCMALKEAMAAGCTAVVTKLGALEEKIDDKINGYLISGHPASKSYQEEFIEKTINLINDNKKLLKFQTNAQNKVKNWTWQNRALEWIQLYGLRNRISA